ncbi:MAG: replicative DNA helicase [Phycisphaeraceae bacterium]|nr:replicative DNA helicase [Phycisphaeraceae bacterium]
MSGTDGDNGAATRTRGKFRPAIEVKLDRLFDRPPPHAPEAEMALLGAMLLDPRVIADVSAIVKRPEDFYVESHAAIYSALLHTYEQHQAGDLALLATILREREQFDAVGGSSFLTSLAGSTPGAAGALHYARIVASTARLRRLIEIGGTVVHEAYHSGSTDPATVQAIVDAAETQIFKIAESDEATGAQPLSAILEEEFSRLRSLQGKALSGIATHYPDLDELTMGLQHGDLIILAARPSMGKTAFALNLAEQIATGHNPYGSRSSESRQVPVGFFSLEMSKGAIAQRLLSAKSGYSTHEMRSGRLKDDDYFAIENALDELKHAPIFIDDTPGLTVMALRSRARRMVSQHGVQALFVDYLQLMTAPGSSESRQVEVSAISRGIKALARELNIPVVCLSQLNRGPENRGDNRPRMSDLRESGSIEQDADVVALLHRESYYHVGDEQWKIDNEDRLNESELIIAKQRNGPTDSVKFTWDARLTRFKSFASYPGGTGFSRSYASPAGPRSPHAPNASETNDPFSMPVYTFSPGRKSGPVTNHRDGGGPDREPDAEPPPFDEETGRL